MKLDAFHQPFFKLRLFSRKSPLWGMEIIQMTTFLSEFAREY